MIFESLKTSKYEIYHIHSRLFRERKTYIYIYNLPCICTKLQGPFAIISGEVNVYTCYSCLKNVYQKTPLVFQKERSNTTFPVKKWTAFRIIASCSLRPHNSMAFAWSSHPSPTRYLERNHSHTLIPASNSRDSRHWYKYSTEKFGRNKEKEIPAKGVCCPQQKALHEPTSNHRVCSKHTARTD